MADIKKINLNGIEYDIAGGGGSSYEYKLYDLPGANISGTWTRNEHGWGIFEIEATGTLNGESMRCYLNLPAQTEQGGEYADRIAYGNFYAVKEPVAVGNSFGCQSSTVMKGADATYKDPYGSFIKTDTAENALADFLTWEDAQIRIRITDGYKMANFSQFTNTESERFDSKMWSISAPGFKWKIEPEEKLFDVKPSEYIYVEKFGDLTIEPGWSEDMYPTASVTVSIIMKGPLFTRFVTWLKDNWSESSYNYVSMSFNAPALDAAANLSNTLSAKVPDAPTDSGTYTLKATVVDGNPTYEWINSASDSDTTEE